MARAGVAQVKNPNPRFAFLTTREIRAMGMEREVIEAAARAERAKPPELDKELAKEMAAERRRLAKARIE